MAKHQHYDYKQSVIEPIFLEDQLVPGTLEYAIHYIVEDRLNMSVFDARYNNDATGRKSIDPKLLLKIVLYGYSHGMISSRSLEYASQKITTFMALACNKTKDADRHRRSTDKRHLKYKSKKRYFDVNDFNLDDRTGKLICPAGCGLYVKNRNFITADGYKAIAYQAPKRACCVRLQIAV